MPEPYALKEASTVLRGARQSNLPYLLDTMQAVMEFLDRNTKINFGAEMKRKHFTLLHFGCYFPLASIRCSQKTLV